MLTLFWTCAVLIVVSQLMILRSTFRAQRGMGDGAEGAGTAPRNGPLEWAFAIVPALALIALLVLTWRATA